MGFFGDIFGLAKEVVPHKNVSEPLTTVNISNSVGGYSCSNTGTIYTGSGSGNYGWTTATANGHVFTSDTVTWNDDVVKNIRLAIPPDGRAVLQYKSNGEWENVPVQYLDRNDEEITPEQHKKLQDKAKHEESIQVIHEDDE